MRELISLDCAAAQQAVMAARGGNPRWSPAPACNRLPEGWADFLAFHCAALAALQEGARGEAYERAVAALPPFVRVFREDEGDWVVHPMRSVVHTLRAAAEGADAEARAAGRRPDRLADCGDQLRKCFSVALQAPGHPGKKLAALDVVNVSIKIYFRLNTLRLCKNLIRTVESRQFAPFESFPAAQRVTYKFYMGRLAVFDENYVRSALRCLDPRPCWALAPAGCGGASDLRGGWGGGAFSPIVRRGPTAAPLSHPRAPPPPATLTRTPPPRGPPLPRHCSTRRRRR